MKEQLSKAGFDYDFFVCFEDNPSSIKQRVISVIRKMAVSLRLVPKTMKGKELLKKCSMENWTPYLMKSLRNTVP